jgi:hypothetical protein
VVYARKAATKFLAESAEPTRAELAAARELTPKLFGALGPKDEKTPREVAEELLRRCEPPRKTYGFALMGLAIILLMIGLAVARM